MVKPEHYNIAAEALLNLIEDSNTLQKTKNIAVFSNVHIEMTTLLKNKGYKVQEFYSYADILQALLEDNYQPEIAFMNWCDRDCWRVFEKLPSHCKILSLYQPLFKTSVDHELNARYMTSIIGISSTYNAPEERRSNIPWDNKVFIYNFQK